MFAIMKKNVEEAKDDYKKVDELMEFLTNFDYYLDKSFMEIITKKINEKDIKNGFVVEMRETFASYWKDRMNPDAK